MDVELGQLGAIAQRAQVGQQIAQPERGVDVYFALRVASTMSAIITTKVAAFGRGEQAKGGDNLDIPMRSTVGAASL